MAGDKSYMQQFLSWIKDSILLLNQGVIFVIKYNYFMWNKIT